MAKKDYRKEGKDDWFHKMKYIHISLTKDVPLALKELGFKYNLYIFKNNFILVDQAFKSKSEAKDVANKFMKDN